MRLGKGLYLPRSLHNESKSRIDPQLSGPENAIGQELLTGHEPALRRAGGAGSQLRMKHSSFRLASGNILANTAIHGNFCMVCCF
jgi:hypothetical protein